MVGVVHGYLLLLVLLLLLLLRLLLAARRRVERLRLDECGHALDLRLAAATWLEFGLMLGLGLGLG